MTEQHGPTNAHDCCRRPSADATRHAGAPDRLKCWSTSAAVASAVLSSACCWLPLLLLALGLSAGGVSGFFEKARPFFLVVATICLGAGFYFIYFHKPTCKPGDVCAVPNPRMQRFNRVMLWMATVVVVGFALFPYFSSTLVRAFAAPPAGTTAEMANDASAVMTRVFHVEGMTCHACAATLEVQLAKLPGVIAANVSYEDGTATIRAALDMPEDSMMREAVERAGYKLADQNG